MSGVRCQVSWVGGQGSKVSPSLQVAAVLTFQRIFVNHLFSTFIPACCLLLLSYSTLFFKVGNGIFHHCQVSPANYLLQREHFKTSLPVAVTTLLGLTATSSQTL